MSSPLPSPTSGEGVKFVDGFIFLSLDGKDIKFIWIPSPWMGEGWVRVKLRKRQGENLSSEKKLDIKVRNKV